MLHLGGVQPLTGEMASAAGFILEDRPSIGELELYRRKGTRFQTVSVVTSIAGFREVDGLACGIPYAISIMPSSKRNDVSEVGVEFVERVRLDEIMQAQEPCYVQFNPFKGSWGAWGSISAFLGEKPHREFPDTLGLVTDMYYLQIDFDPDDVVVVNPGMEDAESLRKYCGTEQSSCARLSRNWKVDECGGADSPIELFMLQSLLREGLTPHLQMLIFDNGSVYPSFYSLWAQALNDVPDFITEADMFFEEQRFAVFCNSTRYHRGAKARQNDDAISRRLSDAGIGHIRIPGSMIRP